MHMSRLGENLERILKQKNLSQNEFARRLGVTKGFISMVINGKKNISLDTLYEMAKVLKCNPKELV